MNASRLYLILTVLLLPLAVGCAGPSHRPHHTGLSKAMEKASDDYKGDRKIETDAEPAPWFDSLADDEDAPEMPAPESAPPIDTTTRGTGNRQTGVIGLSAGYGIIEADGIYQLNHIDVSLGGYIDEKNRLEGFAGYGYALIDETSELDKSIKDASLLYIGARYKHFTTPRYTFLGHYFTAGLAYSKLFWTYENTLYVDGREIDRDNLEGLELFAGMGLHLAQTEHFQLGLEILPSMTLWSAYTDEGFDNDVFGPLYMLKLRLTLSFL